MNEIEAISDLCRIVSSRLDSTLTHHDLTYVSHPTYTAVTLSETYSASTNKQEDKDVR